MTVCKHMQMGSRMKKAIFDEQTNKALKKWQMAVKEKHGEAVKLGKSSARTLDDGSTIGSTLNSPGPTLHRFKTTGHSTRSSRYNDQDHEYESDDVEMSHISQTTSFIVRVDRSDDQQTEDHSEGETSREAEFTFIKPDPAERTTT